MQLGKSNEQMWRGELWRFITPIFVHIEPVHFLVNGILLFFFAPLLEQLIGTARLLVLYMLAGICGVIAGYCFHDQFSGQRGRLLKRPEGPYSAAELFSLPRKLLGGETCKHKALRLDLLNKLHGGEICTCKAKKRRGNLGCEMSRRLWLLSDRL
jgi:hypothetical protein